MRLSPPQTRERIPTLDLISMVDLVFLLIIFFLTTSTFIEKNKSKVSLPLEPGESFQEIRRSSLIVNISQNGSMIVSGEFQSLDQVVRRVQEEIALVGGDASRIDLVVRADRAAPVTALNDLARSLITLDVRAWKLATEAPVGRTAS